MIVLFSQHSKYLVCTFTWLLSVICGLVGWGSSADKWSLSRTMSVNKCFLSPQMGITRDLRVKMWLTKRIAAYLIASCLCSVIDKQMTQS